MKRRLFKISLFLFLGAIVNVVVAWGCAWKLDVNNSPAITKSVNIAGVVGVTPNHMWSVHRYKRTGALRVYSYYLAPSPSSNYEGDPGSLFPSWNPDYFSGIQREELGILVRFHDGRGWPMLSLWGQAVADVNKISPPYYEIDYAILLTDFSNLKRPLVIIGGGSGTFAVIRSVRFLPLHPIWPGFAINTFFYATILWLLTLGPFTARRMIRRKRGICIKCGYDLRGVDHKACPECGVKISPPLSPG